MALQAGLLQPLAEKDRVPQPPPPVADIASGTGTGIQQGCRSQGQRSPEELRQHGGRRCQERPAGSETVAMMKSAVSAANNAFDSVQKPSQATDAAEPNFNAMATGGRRRQDRHAPQALSLWFWDTHSSQTSGNTPDNCGIGSANTGLLQLSPWISRNPRFLILFKARFRPGFFALLNPETPTGSALVINCELFFFCFMDRHLTSAESPDP